MDSQWGLRFCKAGGARSFHAAPRHTTATRVQGKPHTREARRHWPATERWWESSPRSPGLSSGADFGALGAPASVMVPSLPLSQINSLHLRPCLSVRSWPLGSEDRMRSHCVSTRLACPSSSRVRTSRGCQWTPVSWEPVAHTWPRVITCSSLSHPPHPVHTQWEQKEAPWRQTDSGGHQVRDVPESQFSHLLAGRGDTSPQGCFEDQTHVVPSLPLGLHRPSQLPAPGG